MSPLALEQQPPPSRFPASIARRVTTSKPVVEPELTGVRLTSEEELDTSILTREFPTIGIVVTQEGSNCAGGLVIEDFAWRGAFEFARFDDGVANGRPLGVITVRGDDSAGVACEVLARYQRFVARRNDASFGRVFDEVLRRHAGLYDVSSPLVHAELDHAMDTWQWLLRLDPAASLGAQLAALFHDVERLDKDPQEKLEHRAPDHRAVAKDAKATSRGDEKSVRDQVLSIFVDAGVKADDIACAAEILDGYERRAHEVSVLDEADALSFLSLESSRYADHFGLAQTRRKVAHTFGRLGSPPAREKLSLIRLRPDIDRLLRA
jgi:hypothetical protein